MLIAIFYLIPFLILLWCMYPIICKINNPSDWVKWTCTPLVSLLDEQIPHSWSKLFTSSFKISLHISDYTIDHKDTCTHAVTKPPLTQSMSLRHQCIPASRLGSANHHGLWSITQPVSRNHWTFGYRQTLTNCSTILTLMENNEEHHA